MMADLKTAEPPNAQHRGTSRWRAGLRGAIRGTHIHGHCALTGRFLIVIHLQEVGLREHVEPVIGWLLESRKAAVIVVLPQSQLAEYRSAIQSGTPGPKVRWIMSESQFARTRCRPAVVLSIHPETPSMVARRFAGTDTCRVVMQHGLSDKGAFLVEGSDTTDPLADYDVVFLAGPIFREGSLRSYAEVNPASFRRLQFLEIGLPKTDSLFRPNLSRDAVLDELGLDARRPVVCYAPTYQASASLEQAGVEIMRALATLDANIIVKLHHCSLKDPKREPWIAAETGGKDWRAIVHGIEHETPNLRLATRQDANPYLAAADVLVSDASGAAYEYLLLNRPLVFFDTPRLFEEFGTNGIHYWGRACGDIVSGPDTLCRAVQRAIDDPSHNSQQRDAMIQRIVYTCGDASERAGRAILSLAERRRGRS